MTGLFGQNVLLDALPVAVLERLLATARGAFSRPHGALRAAAGEPLWVAVEIVEG